MKDLLCSVAAEANLSLNKELTDGFQSLVAQQTRGGLNEGNIRMMTEAGAFDAAADALTETLRSLRAANRS
jgi:hypothetical protein